MDKENLELQLLIENFKRQSSQLPHHHRQRKHTRITDVWQKDDHQNLLTALFFIALGLILTFGGFIYLLLRLGGLVPVALERLKRGPQPSPISQQESGGAHCTQITKEAEQNLCSRTN